MGVCYHKKARLSIGEGLIFGKAVTIHNNGADAITTIATAPVIDGAIPPYFTFTLLALDQAE